MTEFVYGIGDLKKELRDTVEGTAGFCAYDAPDLPTDEYLFRVGQIASFLLELPKDEVDHAIGRAKGMKKSKFDPRYESRIGKCREMDGMLGDMLGKYGIRDDGFTRYVLYQGVRKAAGVPVNEFEVRTLRAEDWTGKAGKAKGFSTKIPFAAWFEEDYKLSAVDEWLKRTDFDYIEMPLDAYMERFAGRVFNDGEDSFAMMDRKAFRAYAVERLENAIENRVTEAEMEYKTFGVDTFLFAFLGAIMGMIVVGGALGTEYAPLGTISSFATMFIPWLSLPLNNRDVSKLGKEM